MYLERIKDIHDQNSCFKDNILFLVEIDHCQPNPCFHGGFCQPINGGSGFVCECVVGYKGQLCQGKIV